MNIWRVKFRESTIGSAQSVLVTGNTLLQALGEAEMVTDSDRAFCDSVSLVGPLSEDRARKENKKE